MTSSSSPPLIHALSKITCNKLQRELAEWQVNPPSEVKHKVTDNLQRWIIEVNGAQPLERFILMKLISFSVNIFLSAVRVLFIGSLYHFSGISTYMGTAPIVECLEK